MLKSENRGFRVFAHIILAVFSLACLIPFILLISASLSDETTVLKQGYALLPIKFGFTAYQYIANDLANIGRAFGISIGLTIGGTFLSLAVTALIAYPLSRKDLPGRKVFSFLVIFTLLFNGGLVPQYLIYTQMLHIKNTIFGLLIPNLVTNGFIIILMRTYFITSIPQEVLESARIDGATEFKVFGKIVLPMSLPIISTIGLLQGLAYWNDWNNGLIYVTDSKLFSLQNLLNRIMLNIQFLLSTNLGSQSTQMLGNLPSETLRMALAAIAVVPILCAYPFFQKYFVKGITLGAVKG